MIKFFATPCLFFCLSCSAQKFHWSKPDNLPFKEDSITTFNNDLVQDGFIDNIKKTKANIEIRIIIENQGKYGRRQLTKKLYSTSIFDDAIEISGLVFNYDSKVLIGKYTQHSYKKEWRYHPNYSRIDTLFKELIDNKIFEISDQSYWLDSLKINKPDIFKKNEMDLTFNSRGISKIKIVEIKYGNKYRNFRVPQFYPNKALLEIPDLNLSFLLSQFINSIYKLLNDEK